MCGIESHIATFLCNNGVGMVSSDPPRSKNRSEIDDSETFGMQTLSTINISRVDIRRTVEMTASERVTVRITKEQLLLIQDLIDKGKFGTITEIVVSALDEFLGKYYSPENIRKVTVDLPKGNMIRLEELVRDGDSISIDDAIRNAVREYTRNRVS